MSENKNEEKMPYYEGKKNSKDVRENAGDADTNVDRCVAKSGIDDVATTSDAVDRGGDIDDVNFF